MSSTSTKYVFVDLDECLIHTSVFYRSPPREKLAPGFAQAKFKSDSCLYVAQIRPGAHELLRRIREIVPSERVFMLTSSVKEYAHRWDKEFGFNFAAIYHRSDIELCDHEPLTTARFPNANAYLIDNLPRNMNGGKIGFLRAIDPEPTYIQVSEFIRSPDDDYTEKELGDIISCITAPVRKDRDVGQGW